MTGRFILASGYGIEVDSADDPYIEISETFIKSISHATQRGAFLGMSLRAALMWVAHVTSTVDSFPILQYIPSWFPGAQFQRMAARLRKITHEARTMPFGYSEEQMVSGLCIPCGPDG